MLLASAPALSQAPYQKLDSLTALINALQSEVDGQTYRSDEGEEFRLSFPEQGFSLLNHNRLATKAAYKAWSNREVLLLNENLDLTKATGIVVRTTKNGANFVKLFFPEGYLKTKVIENGQLILTGDDRYLEFFCGFYSKKDNVLLTDRMSATLFDLVTSLQVEKGMLTEAQVREQQADWGRLNAAGYLAKHPKSLKAMQATENMERQEAEERRRTEVFLDSMIRVYQLERNITKDAYEAKYPDIADRLFKGKQRVKHAGSAVSYYQWYAVFDGIHEVHFSSAGLINKINYGKMFDHLATQQSAWQSFRNTVHSQVPAQYIREMSDQFIIVRHPDGSYELAIENSVATDDILSIEVELRVR